MIWPASRFARLRITGLVTLTMFGGGFVSDRLGVRRALTLSVLVTGIFSAFILHDLKRVRDGEETNYITATLGVYLSLINVFQSLLMLLGIFGLLTWQLWPFFAAQFR